MAGFPKPQDVPVRVHHGPWSTQHFQNGLVFNPSPYKHLAYEMVGRTPSPLSPLTAPGKDLNGGYVMRKTGRANHADDHLPLFKHPFNDANNNITDWTLDLARLYYIQHGYLPKHYSCDYKL
jgi:hypothetical protein